MLRRNLIGIFLILLYAAVLYPQTFTASVKSTTVGLSDQFEVSFNFSGQDINGVKSFSAPAFKGFMILSGPNQSTSMQIINGAVSGSRSYSYYLQAQNAGKFTIGSAIIKYNDKTFSTQPITITVEKGSPKSSSPQQQQQSNSNVSQKDIADNLFILATADREKVDLGDQVTVTYKLYTRLGIASQMQVAKLPSYEGLWAEEISVPNNITFSTETYKGKQYRVGILKKVALFPSRAGELSVSPLVLDIPVQIQQKRKSNNNLFDDFFNDPFFNTVQKVNYNAKSNTIKLHVNPQPSQNIPKSYNGAVGNYTLTSQISSTSAKANDPVTLKINISGSGNIQLLNMPEITLPAGFDKYDPKTSEQINRTGRINGSKTFEYLIVPRSPGKKEIPPIQFSYYNPERKSYVTLSTPTYSIDVQPGTGGGSASGYTKEEIRLLGQDIKYIKTSNNDIARKGDTSLLGFGFWAAAILPLILLSGLIIWKRRTDKLAGNLQLMRYQRAQKIARARFKTAKTFMDANDQNGFYAEISQALFGYLEDKFHIPKAEMSLDRAVDELQSKNTDVELINNLKGCIEKCEYARFAPDADGATAMNDMYNDLTKVIIELEKSLSVKKNV
ncbi:MAG: BatD family protein [Ignavibacteriaceae bacterium]|nr:BatD family protein [Ignavibacteriaceae bacterium]